MKNIKYLKKQIITFLLVFVMTFSLFPIEIAAAIFGNPRETTLLSELAADEIIVYNESDFKNALKNPDFSTIYFGADIQLTSRVTIAQRHSGKLTINGTNPFTGERFQYEDHYVVGGAALQSNVSLYMASKALTREVVFKDIDILGYNIYGVITCGSFQYDAITVVFDNVTGTYNQFIALFASKLIIRNSVLTVSNSNTGSVSEEAAEVSTLIFEGDVEVYHNNTSGYSLFNFYAPAAGEIIIRENANVLLKTTNNSFGCFHFFVSKRTVTMEKESNLTYIGRDRFSLGTNYGRLDSFTLQEGAKATLIMPENNTQLLTPGGLNADTITINQNADLSIFANSSSTINTPLKTNNLNLINPGKIIMYNAGNSNLMQAATNINAEGIKSIRYYTDTSNSFDFESYTYSKRTDYSKWFFQETGNYNLKASNWGSSAANNITTNYSSSTMYDEINTTSLSTAGIKVIQINGALSRKPTINTVIEGMTQITGTGIPEAIIEIESEKTGVIISTTVGKDGKWSAISETAYIKDDILTITQSELLHEIYNNPSEAIQTKVIEKLAGLTPNNNTTKTYNKDMLTMYIKESSAENFAINKIEYIILNNPDETIEKENSTQFENAYKAAEEGKAGEIEYLTYNAAEGKYIGTIGEIENNCTIWMRVKLEIEGNTIEIYDNTSYKNIYKPYTIKARGIIAEYLPETDILYNYKDIEGEYGVPYTGDGETIYENPTQGYDTIYIEIDPNYKEHWNGRINNQSTPYTLTLDRNFTTNNTICDNNDILKYTINCEKTENMWWDNVPIEYITEAGTPITISSATQPTISVPLNNPSAITSTNFHNLGGRYTPPADDTYNPIGWVTGEIYKGTYKEQSNFNNATFNPEFNDITKEKLYIIYKTGQFKLTEQYQDEEGITIAPDNRIINDASNPEDYNGNPADIRGYVPKGYKITGSKNNDTTYEFDYNNYTQSNAPTENQYQIFPEIKIEGTELMPAETNGAITITYYYTKDTNENGIPDKEETTLTIKWQGQTPTGHHQTTLQAVKTIYSRKNHTITITNKHPEAGDENHKITYNDTEWIFDKWQENNTASRNINMDGTQQETIFTYGISTDKETLDNRQYVIEKYHYLNQNEDNNIEKGTPIPNQTEIKQYKLKSESYNKTPQTIEGYTYIGYRLEDENGNPIDTQGNQITQGSTNTITYKNGAPAKNIAITIDTNPERYTIINLYKETAKPIQITWKGTTYVGNQMQLATITKQGYKGEEITIKPSEQAIGEHWQLIGAYKENGDEQIPQSDKNELKFTMGNEAQRGEFRYKETTNNVTITVIYQSDDGNINITFKNDTLLTGSPIEVNTLKLSGYEQEEWTITDRFGNELEKGSKGNTPTTINPANGTQTLTIKYKTKQTSLYIRNYDNETGEEIPDTAQKIDNINIDETYAATARAINGYTLAQGEKQIKNTKIQKGTNTITFYYDKITGGTLILREAIYTEDMGEIIKDEGRIINYININKEEGEEIPIPDLAEYYYTTASETAENYRQNETITYYYNKEMIDTEVIAIDEDTQAPLKIKQLKKDARKGEMYQAITDITIQGYTLADSQSKITYADPEAENNTIKIPFTYRADQTGDVTIKHYYKENEAEVELNNITIKTIIGSKFTATAQTYEGFELETKEEPIKEITVTKGKNEIAFQYKDQRKTITINHYTTDKNGNEKLNSQETHKAAANSETTHSIAPKYIENYKLTGYKINETPYTPVQAGENEIQIGTITNDIQINLYYKEIEEAEEAGEVEEIEEVEETNNKQTTITIKLINDDTKVEIIPQIKVNATTNQPITYNAPDLHTETGRYYYQTKQKSDNPKETSLTGRIDNPASDGTSTIEFYYKEINSNMILIAKEENQNGNILKIKSIDTTECQPGQQYTIPTMNLENDYYTYQNRYSTQTNDENETITTNEIEFTYNPTEGTQIIEAYYKKEQMDIPIVAKEANETIINNTYKHTNARMGETAIIDAPEIEGYEIEGNNYKIITAIPGAEAHFYYSAQIIQTSQTTLQITTTNAATGEAIANAQITATNTETNTTHKQITNQNGKAEIANILPGTYEIETTASGYKSTTTTITTNTLQTTIHITLTPNTTTDTNNNTNGGSGGNGTSTGNTEKKGYLTIEGQDEKGNILYTETIEKKIGETITVTAQQVEGYKLASQNTKEITIATDSSKNKITFHYTKTNTEPENETGNEINTEDETANQAPQLTTKEHIKYIHGYKDESIRPNNNLTRAEVAVILYTLIDDKNKNTPISTKLIDVAQNAWYTQAIAYLEKHKIITGYPNGQYKPNNNITRAEFAVLLSRINSIETQETETTQITSIKDTPNTHWAIEHIKNVLTKKWFQGYPDKTFKPNNKITRAEAITAINNKLERKIKTEHIPQNVQQYKDLNKTHWAYSAIMEASTPHNYEKTDDGYETWIISIGQHY